MKEFLKDYYTILTLSFEFIAALTGVFLYKKYKGTPVKYFIWFLLWIFVNEIIGNYPSHLKNFKLFYLIKGTILEKNYWWFTIFWTSSATLFYAWFLSRRYKSNLFKNIILYSKYLFIVVIILTIIFRFDNFFVKRETYIDMFSLGIILVSSIFYLYELLNSEKLIDFYRSIYFYIASIIFIWWLVTTPLGFFEVYNTQEDWDYVTIKWTIKLATNIFMYLGFTIALIVSNPDYE